MQASLALSLTTCLAFSISFSALGTVKILFGKQKEMSEKSCIVDFCLNKSPGDPATKFFSVPRKHRDSFLKLCTKVEYSETSELNICDRHFSEKDFIKKEDGTAGEIHEQSFPTRNLPYTENCDNEADNSSSDEVRLGRY